MLPGVPLLLRQKWHAIRGFLMGQSLVRPFKSLTLRLSLSDETDIAAALEAVDEEFGRDVKVL